MSTTTELHKLPAPSLGDPPNGPAQIQSLADKLDLALGRVTAGLQAGVVDAASYEVTQASGGASTTIDIASHAGAGALIRKTSATGQLLGYVAPTVAKTTKTIANGHATLPRVDRVVLELDGDITVLQGTATSGATLDNLTGAVSVPDDTLLLADVHVPATDTTIANSQIRDRRKWARGAKVRVVRNANAAAGSDYTLAGTTLALIDSTNMAPRIECSGVPVTVRLVGVFDIITPSGAPAADAIYFHPQLDSQGVDGMCNVGQIPSALTSGLLDGAAPGRYVPNFTWTFVPSAGSHIIAPAWCGINGETVRLRASAQRPCMWLVEEDVRQNTANNPTTSG